MKYAKEIIGLFGSYPERDWRMTELVRYVAPNATVEKRHSIRRAVLRVLVSLEDAGVLIRTNGLKTGEHATYRWKSAT